MGRWAVRGDDAQQVWLMRRWRPAAISGAVLATLFGAGIVLARVPMGGSGFDTNSVLSHVADQLGLPVSFGHHRRGFGYGAGVDSAQIAAFLGISQSQLRAERTAPHATLASVAQAHGRSRSDLEAFISSQAKSLLDQRVADKELTQQQEDSMLSTSHADIDSLIDRSFSHGKDGGVELPSRTPRATASPNAPGA
jgi:hypothetical protein